MYFKQKNKTAIQSQHMIADALFCLLKRKPFAQITVTEICEEAAIGRKTFYRNFELREDVIEFQLDNMCVEYIQEIDGMPIEERLVHHFEYVKRNKEYFILLYKNGFNEVDVSDVMNLANYVLKKKTEVFIEEVSDVTEDNEIDVADAMGIVNIVLKKE